MIVDKRRENSFTQRYVPGTLISGHRFEQGKPEEFVTFKSQQDIFRALRDYTGYFPGRSMTEVEIKLFKKEVQQDDFFSTFLGHQVQPNERFYRFNASLIDENTMMFGGIIMVESEIQELSRLMWETGCRLMCVGVHRDAFFHQHESLNFPSKEFIKTHEKRLMKQENLILKIAMFYSHNSWNYHTVKRVSLNYRKIWGIYYTLPKQIRIHTYHE